MTVGEQQALFERTRVRIQQNLQEVSALAERASGGDQFFPAFVRLAVDSLSGIGGALWHAGKVGLECIVAQNFESSQFNENPSQKRAVEHVLAEVAKLGRSHIVPPGGRSDSEAVNSTAFPFFYAPVIHDGRVAFILQVWIPDNGDPKTYHDINSFLHSWCQHAVVFLRNQQRAALAGRNEELNLVVRMQAELLGELDPKEVAAVTVNYACDCLKADLVGLFRRHGKSWRLIAASNQEVVDHKGQQTRELGRFAETLEDAPSARVRNLEGAETSTFEGTDYRSVVWRCVHSHHGHPDYILAAFRHEAPLFNQETADILDRLAIAAGKSIDASHHHHGLPLRSVSAIVARWLNDWRCHRRRGLLTAAAVLAVLGVVLFLVPVPLKISTACMVEPQLLAPAVAEAQGKISEILVREGQVVQTGEVLARIDDREYATQLAVLRQQRLRWQVEALRAQTAGSEPDRKLAEVNLARDDESVKRIEYLRSKTEIRAPITGIILTKNLQNRIGEPLEPGARFCEIASTDDYDLVLEIRQNDIGDVLRALQREGKLPVHFILHSHPRFPLTATVSDAHSISELPEIRADHSAFLIRIPFPKGSPIDDLLKPGYTGKAKLRLGTSNLFYVWFRPFFNFWRVEWGV